MEVLKNRPKSVLSGLAVFCPEPRIFQNFFCVVVSSFFDFVCSIFMRPGVQSSARIRHLALGFRYSMTQCAEAEAIVRGDIKRAIACSLFSHPRRAGGQSCSARAIGAPCAPSTSTMRTSEIDPHQNHTPARHLARPGGVLNAC